MKAFKSIQLSGINIAIYAFLILISISAIRIVGNFANRIFLHPPELSDFDHGNPHFMAPFNQNVFFILREDLLKNDLHLYQTIKRNELIFNTTKGIITLVLLFMIAIQLRVLLNSLQNKTFFVRGNILCVRKISYLLVIWVVIDFVLYQCFQFFIPLSIVQENYNYTPINMNVKISLLFSINYLRLLTAFAFYVISVVFKEGYHLKEESDLTI
jgi:hypothetical protein